MLKTRAEHITKTVKFYSYKTPVLASTNNEAILEAATNLLEASQSCGSKLAIKNLYPQLKYSINLLKFFCSRPKN